MTLHHHPLAHSLGRSLVRTDRAPSVESERDWGWALAALLVAVAAVVAVVVTGLLAQHAQTGREFTPPESRRPMVMAPLPR